MIRYKCPACGKSQYSASEKPSPCIYCGNEITVSAPMEGEKEDAEN